MRLNILETIFQYKSKYIERDKGIFLDRLIKGENFKLIAEKYDVTKQRAEQIYNRTLFRLSYPIIDRMHKECRNAYWEGVIELKDKIKEIQNEYTGVTQIKDYWKEIQLFKKDVLDFLEKYEKQYNQYSKPYNQIEERIKRTFELFDMKLTAIQSRIAKLESIPNH